MLINNKPFQNAIQGAVLRNQIAGAKSDGHVTTGEANALIARARSGGVQPSELQALRQLALESRNSNKFDAGAKAALNNFLGTSADRSFASGRLPPEANLPQNLKIFGSAIGQTLDKARLNALDKHFKKDDGRIGAGEMRSIMRNIFKDGNVSPTERKYLQDKLKDPAVSAEAKKEIRNLLNLLPGGRITEPSIFLPPLKFPRPFPGFPGLPGFPPPPPTSGSGGSTGVPGTPGGTTPPGGGTTTPPGGGTTVPGGGGTTPTPPTQGTGGTGGTTPTGSGKFPAFPEAPKDPKDLNAQNEYQKQMFEYQQAQQQMMQFWQMMTTTLKASGDSIKSMIQNLR